MYCFCHVTKHVYAYPANRSWKFQINNEVIRCVSAQTAAVQVPMKGKSERRSFTCISLKATVTNPFLILGKLEYSHVKMH